LRYIFLAPIFYLKRRAIQMDLKALKQTLEEPRYPSKPV
jgi:hypothetical protein